MGTRLAASYANLFMGWFEETYVYSYRLQPVIWKRYIDDIFFIWQHGESGLRQFVEHLNQCHNTIKFTMEFSPAQVNFLDITVKRTQGTKLKLETTLYCKPTDSHNYLLYSSEHPRHFTERYPLFPVPLST